MVREVSLKIQKALREAGATFRTMKRGKVIEIPFKKNRFLKGYGARSTDLLLLKYDTKNRLRLQGAVGVVERNIAALDLPKTHKVVVSEWHGGPGLLGVRITIRPPKLQKKPKTPKPQTWRDRWGNIRSF